MEEPHTLESFSNLTRKKIKQSYVYKNIPNGLNKSKLRKGEIIMLIKENEEWLEQEEPCMICHEPNTLRLSCHKNHTVHEYCMNSWMKSSGQKNCLLCDKPILN